MSDQLVMCPRCEADLLLDLSRGLPAGHEVYRCIDCDCAWVNGEFLSLDLELQWSRDALEALRQFKDRQMSHLVADLVLLHVIRCLAELQQIEGCALLAKEIRLSWNALDKWFA